MLILVVGKIGRAATAAGNAQNQVKSKKGKVKKYRIQGTTFN